MLGLSAAKLGLLVGVFVAGAAGGGWAAWEIRTAALERLRTEMAEGARKQAEQVARENAAAIAELNARHDQELAALRADRDAAATRARQLSAYQSEVQRNAPALTARLPADLRDAVNRLLERAATVGPGPGGASQGGRGGAPLPVAPAAARP